MVRDGLAFSEDFRDVQNSLLSRFLQPSTQPVESGNREEPEWNRWTGPRKRRDGPDQKQPSNAVGMGKSEQNPRVSTHRVANKTDPLHSQLVEDAFEDVDD